MDLSSTYYLFDLPPPLLFFTCAHISQLSTSPNMTIVPLITAFLLMLLLIGTIYLCSATNYRLRRHERVESGGVLPPLNKSQLCNFKESTVQSRFTNLESIGCVICLSDFEKGDRVRTLPCCHVFHSTCIDVWLTSKTRTCPMCKSVILRRSTHDNVNNRSWWSLIWWPKSGYTAI